MRLQKQDNGWSCGTTSLAMLLGLSVPRIERAIGHDGSEIIDPAAKEPRCRRSFSISELQDACCQFGFALAPFEACPVIEKSDGSEYRIYSELDAEHRLKQVMDGIPGLIEGCYSLDQPHMVAWDGQNVFDPTGPRSYDLYSDKVERISIACFWKLTKG